MTEKFSKLNRWSSDRQKALAVIQFVIDREMKRGGIYASPGGNVYDMSTEEGVKGAYVDGLDGNLHIILKNCFSVKPILGARDNFAKQYFLTEVLQGCNNRYYDIQGDIFFKFIHQVQRHDDLVCVSERWIPPYSRKDCFGILEENGGYMHRKFERKELTVSYDEEYYEKYTKQEAKEAKEFFDSINDKGKN